MKDSERKKIELNTNIPDMFFIMSEGNPGALSVLGKAMKKDFNTGFAFILNLDDMNIRGSQIWVGYKDFAKEDIDEFMIAAKERNAKMVELINKQCPGNKAVVSGAS